MKEKTRVLVTGAGGFIGSHLVTYLQDKGFRVRGVDEHFPGPAHGGAGVRARTGFARTEPAFGTILKPTAGILPETVGALVEEAAARAVLES